MILLMFYISHIGHIDSDIINTFSGVSLLQMWWSMWRKATRWKLQRGVLQKYMK